MAILGKYLALKVLKKVAIVCLSLTFGAFIIFHVFSIIFPFDLDKLAKVKKERCATVVWDKNKLPLRAFRGKADTWTFWISLHEMNPKLKEAFIAVEDKRFHSHFGVDPLAILRAVLLNIVCRRRVSGGSTLTMQTIRMIEQNPRTYSAKIKECFRAVQMESLMSKEEILELYINLCPFGSNIYGVEAAARLYFGKSSHDLNLAELALLAGLPQRPTVFRPDVAPGKAKKRRDYVLQRMEVCGYISSTERESASNEEVTVTRHPVYFKAPHFSRLAKAKNSSHFTADRFNVFTTIDQNIQSIAEFSMAECLKDFSDIHNGGIVVIENKTCRIRAMVGALDFFDSQHAGQVNACTALRSPGSTLKPFIYAIGLEKGAILPSTGIDDSAISFNGYCPLNYDRKFHGEVSVAEALVNSYNIPALKLLKQYGIDNFIEKLRRCGVSSLNRSSDYYGLPLILGSGEVRLLELTAAYTVFPNGGVFRSPKIYIFEKETANRVFSEATADMINYILINDSYGRTTSPLASRSEMEIAWKTGTSFGLRDAWTIGYNSEYTVGVWLGNADGRSSKSLVGISSAVPLCLSLIKQISSPQKQKFQFSKHFTKIRVCSISGMPAGNHCHTTEDGVGNSQIHYKSCRCQEVKRKKKLCLLAPLEGEYLKLPSKPNQKLPLKAIGATEEIYWYINGIYFDSSKNGEEIFWKLKKGKYQIVCADTKGLSKSVKLEVK